MKCAWKNLSLFSGKQDCCIYLKNGLVRYSDPLGSAENKPSQYLTTKCFFQMKPIIKIGDSVDIYGLIFKSRSSMYMDFFASLWCHFALVTERECSPSLRGGVKRADAKSTPSYSSDLLFSVFQIVSLASYQGLVSSLQEWTSHTKCTPVFGAACKMSHSSAI